MKIVVAYKWTCDPEEATVRADGTVDWSRAKPGLSAYDPVAIENRHVIGVDKMMWSTDFPHGITEWPHSRRQGRELFKDVPEDELRMLMQDNALRFYNIEI